MGEFELLRKVQERLPRAGPQVRLGSGDDAAVTAPEGVTATSVDALVEGVHFRREWASLAQIGRKALAVALSDLAAMAATPGEAYVVLGIPSDLDEGGCLELLEGIAGLAEASGTTLAGGDVTRAPALTLAITVVGHAESVDDLVQRGGARPGDALVVTGELGGAAAGLLLLERGLSEPAADGASRPAPGGETGAPALCARLLEPQPRLEAGRALAAAGATAMIDLSDGLGGDAGHLATASGVGLRIEAAAIPVQTGVPELADDAGRDPLELAVSGGEDYELLATLPSGRVAEAKRAVEEQEGVELTQIGEVLGETGVEIRLPGGGTLEPAGFDQLARPGLR